MVRSWLVAACGALMTGPCLADDVWGSPALPCTVPEGAYFAAAPTWHAGDPPRPAVVFLHGAGGSGAVAVEDPSLGPPITGRGYVLLAPTGQARPDRDGFFWSLGSRPPLRDEAAFLAYVLDDAAARFHLDRNRVFVTGFSMGAGVVWQLACHDPSAYAAYGPVAGGFWRGQPTGCAGPVKLLLTHGWRDDAVPLEGWEQDQAVEGGIFDEVQLWRRLNGCPNPHADSFAAIAQFWQRTWTDCAPGSALTFVLHPDGHEVPAGWADMALDWFETVVPASH